MNNEQMIAGALFDLMGFLTSSETRWKFSAYDDATRAIEALRQFAEKRGLNLDEARVVDWQSALSSQSQSDKQDAWISVETQVPEGCGDVLAVSATGHVQARNASTVRELVRAAKKDGEHSFVTHWMPLPEAPIAARAQEKAQ